MQEKNLSKISRSVTGFFNDIVKTVGKTCKFVQRKSKLDAKLFAETLIMGAYVDAKMSLEGMCQMMRSKGVKITKQGLHERFTPQATAFMENLFEVATELFRSKGVGGIDLLKVFTSVELLDSSGISLPEVLKELYPGFGGGASEAGLKLQVLFNYIENQLEIVKITAGRKNDQSFKTHLNRLKKGSLYLQDLGYFCIDSFRKMEAAGAYFISRYLPQTKVCDENNEPIELLQMLANANGFYTRQVRLGKKDSIEVRLVASALPEEEVKKRHDKILKEAKKKGRTPTEELLELAKWSIYITNVPRGMVTDEQIHLVYTLRWQIELFFKLCKSEAGIDKINSKKSDRVQCEIYAKLISVMVLLCICQPVRWQEKQELSLYKAYKRLKQSAISFFKALESPYCMLKFLKEFLGNLKDFALKEKNKKKRPLSFQKLMEATSQEALV